MIAYHLSLSIEYGSTMNTNTVFGVQMPTAIEFGVGVAANVGERATDLGLRHVLLVTDRGLAESAGVTEALRALAASGVAATLYSDVTPDPSAASVTRAAETYRAAQADGVIALGGGSTMDTAKALLVLAADRTDDIVPYFFGGTKPIPALAPLICLPTTAGTGAEVTYVAIVTHAREKCLVRHPHLAPRVALIDPALTLSMSARLTVASGLDALAHALEALTSRLANPFCDTLALDALARIARSLPRALDRGDNLHARSEMSLAALNAGLAFLNARLHLGHAVGHSLGTHFTLAHGIACGLCLPAILDFLRDDCALALQRAAQALGDSDAVRATRHLLAQVGAPGVGQATGLSTADVSLLIDIVEREQRLIGLSPRRPGADDWKQIFVTSW
jgi:alcohol dehydrogenase class IV